MHAARTASSFRAGTIAVTEGGTRGGSGISLDAGLCASIAIFYWMRKGRFLKDQGVIFPTFREPTRKLALDYGTSMYPDTYIIDRHGKIARKFFGPQQWDSPDMRAYFDAILGRA